MVAKISTGGNMFGALAYNQNKVDNEEAKVGQLCGIVFRHTFQQCFHQNAL